MKSKKMFSMLIFGLAVLTVFVLIGGFSRATLSAAKAPDSTIGYVDMDRIQKEHPDFISLMSVINLKEDEFNKFRSYLNSQLEGVQKDLNSQMEQEKEGKSSDDQAKIEQKYQEQFQVKQDDLKNQLNQKNAEITDYINQQKAAVMDKLKKVCEAVADDLKLTLVLDKSALLCGGQDITQNVLDKVKANAKNATPAPK